MAGEAGRTKGLAPERQALEGGVGTGVGGETFTRVIIRLSILFRGGSGKFWPGSLQKFRGIEVVHV